MTKHVANKRALIAQMPTSRLFTARECEILSALFHQRFYMEDEEIYLMNGPSVAAYYVIDGSVGIFKAFKNGVSERIAYVRPSQWFGYSALVDDRDRDSTARALEKTSCFVLFKTDFMTLKNNEAKCALQLLTNMCCDLIQNLREIQHDYFSLAGKLGKMLV